MEIERKWQLLDPPTPETLVLRGAKVLELSQTYLTLEQPGVHRVRHTSSSDLEVWEFVTKVPLSPGINQETTQTLTKEEYHAFLKHQDLSRQVITKTRYVLALEEGELLQLSQLSPEDSKTPLYYEFDYFSNPDKLRVLEIEFSNTLSLTSSWNPPAWVGRCQDVTQDKRYSNHWLAKEGAPSAT